MKLTFETVTPDEIVGPKKLSPPMQMHMTWIDGEDKDENVSFSVSCGAGLGSSLLQISVTLADGRTIYDYGSIGPLVEEWVNRLREREAVTGGE